MISIRRAGKEDAPALACLERECFSEPWSERALADELALPYAVYLAAQDDTSGEVVGYAGMRVIGDEGQIANLAVTALHRRRGIGHALMAALEEEARARGANVLQLEVRASGEDAIRLYARRGFLRVGLRRRFYRMPTEDAILMNLML